MEVLAGDGELTPVLEPAGTSPGQFTASPLAGHHRVCPVQPSAGGELGAAGEGQVQPW